MGPDPKYYWGSGLLTILWLKINQSIVAMAKNFTSNESFECSLADNVWRLKIY
jgi:hypothetical protein